ncbi:IS110 family transposase [Actinomadura sp. KC216]|uniref:IS110 family transposase n=1 Tax=Actinomadura sp. KC216 TaxID=2530370 RepID=UPI00104A1CFA|nr:IS110 family transposase [Actinomadura sp. KC216]TDB71142.1 IS110 family transposase [Actinomadura sp. KC216]
MILLGVDPHKSTHTATALHSATNQPIDSVRIDAALAGYRRLLAWGRQWPRRRWVIENARGLGRHLAQWLLARGEEVLDVPSTATARVRQLSRGGGRKNDRIDAAAAATIAATQGDACPVDAEDHTTALALLDERRTNLTQTRVRAVNQLHTLLRDLLPGGAPAQLSARAAAALLRTVRPAGPAEHARKQLARDLVADIRRLDEQLAANAQLLGQAVAEAGSTLMGTAGIGPVMAARLIARTGRVGRFPTPAAFASYCGTAPIEIASAGKARHRLSRSGDRQLNAVLHTIAVIQIRMPRTTGRAYYDRKIAEGKTPKEAKRCLKRRLTDHIWRVMTSDERHRTPTGSGGHSGATLPSSATGSTPTAGSSDKSLPEPASGDPTPAPP